MLDIAQRTVIGSAIEEAVTVLPEDCGICIYLDKGRCSVALNPKFDSLEWEHDAPLTKLSDLIRDAIQEAIKRSR